MTPAYAQVLLQTTTNSIGQPIGFPRDGTPEITGFIAELAPGADTGWHTHPVQLMGYILEGALTVVQVTGHKRVVPAGEISLESVGVVHKGLNEGAVPCKMIVFAAGLKGVPFRSDALPPV